MFSPAVVVFDFDGTLVDSNDVKRELFFRLCFEHALDPDIVTEVLDEIGEASRYDIFREILRRNGVLSAELAGRTKQLARAYGQLVANAVVCCAEKPYASDALSALVDNYKLYVSSTTPRDQLERFISLRGWSPLFVDVYGYPSRKPETLRQIMGREGCDPNRVLVVGDGASDCNAAAETGCSFYAVRRPDALLELLKVLDNV